MEIKKKERVNHKIIRTFCVDKELYSEFKSHASIWNLNISALLSEFIKEVCDAIVGERNEIIIRLKFPQLKKNHKIEKRDYLKHKNIKIRRKANGNPLKESDGGLKDE